MENVDWNVKVKEALDRSEFMAISTTGIDGSWTNPVAYAYSEKMELFFISMMDSKHAKNILAKRDISGAIFKTERFEGGDVLGLQYKGTAQHLTKQADIDYAAKYYFGNSPANDAFRLETSEKGGIEAPWQFFKITPSELWCFDSRVFGEQRRQVELSALNLILKA